MPTLQEQGLLLNALPSNLPPCNPPGSSSSHPLPSFWQSHYHDHSPWQHHNRSTALPLDTVDVVIIGSGITGVSAAAHIIDRLQGDGTSAHAQNDGPLSVIILEAREFCSGATARNGGHLTALPRLQYRDLRDKYGSVEARREVMLEDRVCSLVIEQIQRKGWQERVDLVQGGNIHLLRDEREVQEVRAQVGAAREDGIDVRQLRWLDRDELHKLVGAKAFAGLWIPGSNLYPLKYVSHLFSHTVDRCQAHRPRQGRAVQMDLYTHAPVSSVDRAPKTKRAHISMPIKGARWVVTTSRGQVQARTVIHATNGYASSVVPSLATGSNRIVPTRGQVISYLPSPSQILSPSSSNPHWTTAFASPGGGAEYWFQRPHGGPIILGGARFVAGAPYEFGQTDDGVVNAHVRRALVGYLPELFPGTFGKEGGRPGIEEMCWSGIMGYRENGVPMVGSLYDRDGAVLQGQFISAGYSGHGMARAPACAQVVAEMALAELAGEMYQLPQWFPRRYLSGPSAERCELQDTVRGSESGSHGTRVWWCNIS